MKCNPLLDELPSVSETVKAITLLSSGKALESDAIPAEIYKARGSSVAENLTELFLHNVEKRSHPSRIQGCNNLLSTYSKGKGILKSGTIIDASLYHQLLSIAGKIFARVLLNEHLEQSGLLPESQCGFRKDRGTIDMIFTARQLQEKCQGQNVDLYMTFVDLTKAFVTVRREGLWKIMTKFG